MSDPPQPEQPAEETSEKAAGQPSETPSGETPAEPVEETVTTPAGETQATAMGEAVEKPAAEESGKPVGEAVEKPAAESSGKPAAKTGLGTDQPAARGDDPAGGSTEQAGKKGLLLGLGAAAVVVVLVLAAFVWPGFLAGPGKPDQKAAEAAAALASKDPGQLDKVSCHGPDGKPTAQAFPPQALQLIQSATSAGPPRLTLDTQALAPIDLTLGAQGRTEKLPADLLLGVTHGQWCMNGITQRQ